MTHEEKKDLERSFVIAFLQAIGNSNHINSIDREEPDFLLYDSQIIGIEVTQLFTEPKNGEVSRVSVEGGYDDVVDLAHKMWIYSGGPIVDVRIMFNDTIHIRKTEKSIIATELIKIIDHYLPESGESFWSEDEILGLPRGIVEFHMHRDVRMKTSTWRLNDAAWTPQLTTGIVQKRITEKEEKRNAYLQNCDLIWLLLVLYGRRPSASFIIPESTYLGNYHLGFDKAFLFDAIPKHVWELNRY